MIVIIERIMVKIKRGIENKSNNENKWKERKRFYVFTFLVN
jgi:hypothetical protein